MKPFMTIICLILLAACGNDRSQNAPEESAPADQTSPSEIEATVLLGEAVAAPEQHGPYDAAWWVSVDIDALHGLSAGERLPHFMVLPELGRVDLHINDTEGEPRRVLRGDAHPAEGAGGSFTLSLRADRLEGQFRLERRRYLLQTQPDGRHLLFRLDEDQMPDPHPPGGPLIPDEPEPEGESGRQ